MSDSRMIYAIICVPNKKVYVGQTNNLKARLNDHFFFLKSDKTSWNDDLKKYGKKRFNVVILEDNVPLENGNERELYWIEKFHAFDYDKGYNVAIPCFRRKSWE